VRFGEKLMMFVVAYEREKEGSFDREMDFCFFAEEE
jgi:hypothetical protein